MERTLVMTLVVCMMHVGHVNSQTAPDVKPPRLLARLEALDRQKAALFAKLSEVRAICGRLQEDIGIMGAQPGGITDLVHGFQDRHEPRIHKFIKHAKDYTHQVDHITELADKADLLGQQTTMVLDEQIKSLQAVSQYQLGNQTEAIKDINVTMFNGKQGFLDELNRLIIFRLLPVYQLSLSITTDVIMNNNRKRCESGVGSFQVGRKLVSFDGFFAEKPVVTFMVTGFTSHLDINSHHHQHHHHPKDVLHFDKIALEVTNSNFTVSLDSQSMGAVGLKTVHCSWMACTGLEPTTTNRPRGPQQNVFSG